LIMVAKPLISTAFEHGSFTDEDTAMVLGILGFYALGLCGYFAQQILARAFYSMQDSKTPMRSAVIAVFVNVILNLTLIWFMGTKGLALSTALCSYLQVVILASLLRRRVADTILDGFGVTLAKTILATVFMYLAGAGIISVTGKLLPDSRWFNILRLAAVVPSAAAVYLLSAKLLHIKMLSLLTGRKGESQKPPGI